MIRTAAICTVIASAAAHKTVAAQPELALPHISVDREERVVEVSARVSPLIHAGDDDEFLLEQIMCTPDTKAHESLLVTDALPSHIHAALLLIGLEPGTPTTWERTESGTIVHPPNGPRVRIEIEHESNGNTVTTTPRAWIRHRDDEQVGIRQRDHVFAGSVITPIEGRERYEADVAGTIIGLASFGTEVLAWPEVISHTEADGELIWYADHEAIPPNGTPVTVRITPVPDGG